MKRKIRKLHIIALSGLLLLAGCSKTFTVQTPVDSVPLDQALATEGDINAALNGAYANLRNIYGTLFLPMGDVQADNTYVEFRNSGRYIPQYSYTVTIEDAYVGQMWSQSYRGILRANQVIDAKVTSGKAAAIKAEAYAIRALLYFKLVNIYAKPYRDDPDALGVPLVLTYLPYLLPVRSTVKQVYTQIVSDLKVAFKDAPDYVNSVHLSKYAIEGLLAKVYLYQGDFPNAKAAADDVINNSQFSLVRAANFNAFWANPAIQSDQAEVMFEVDADAVNNNGFDDVSSLYINGYQDLYASSQLYDLYRSSDIRKTLLVPGTTKSGSPAYLVNKFSNARNGDKDNLKVIRFSEIYLIAAEASLPGDEMAAKGYLNALVAQRDPGLVYSSAGTGLLNDIVQERRKELAFEGDRFYDLNRLKLPINRAPNPGAIPAGQNDVNHSIPYPDYNRLAPIPKDEILANPMIAPQQNPGY